MSITTPRVKVKHYEKPSLAYIREKIKFNQAEYISIWEGAGKLDGI